MPESIYAYVLDRLRQAKGQWPLVAEGSGVPLRSVEKIAREEWENPGVKSIEAIASYFRRCDARRARAN